MISEIELLQEEIPRLEQKFGAHNPFVEVLKAHLKALQGQAKPLPQTKPHHRGWVNFLRFPGWDRKDY
jgi:hypothetical protein